MKEVIKINKCFFELTKSEQRNSLRVFFYWAIKYYIKSFKK